VGGVQGGVPSFRPKGSTLAKKVSESLPHYY
jgi:hypothetical protein